MTRMSSGRAQILGAQVVSDVYGTALIIAANTAGSVSIPSSGTAVGVLIHRHNTDYRIRFNCAASTALTLPHSGYLRGDTEYAFPLNPSVTNIGFISTVPGTVQLTWIIGAGG